MIQVMTFESRTARGLDDLVNGFLSTHAASIESVQDIKYSDYRYSPEEDIVYKATIIFKEKR